MNFLSLKLVNIYFSELFPALRFNLFFVWKAKQKKRFLLQSGAISNIYKIILLFESFFRLDHE